MTRRHAWTLLTIASTSISPLAAQDSRIELPQRPPGTVSAPSAAVPNTPSIAGRTLEEAGRAVDDFALHAAAAIESLSEPEVRERADELEAELDDIQDVVERGQLEDAQRRLEEFRARLASACVEEGQARAARAFAAVVFSHASGDEGAERIPDRATFERLAYQSEDALIEPHLRGVQRKFRKLYARPRSGGPFAMEVEFKITAAGELAIKQARPWVY